MHSRPSWTPVRSDERFASQIAALFRSKGSKHRPQSTNFRSSTQLSPGFCQSSLTIGKAQPFSLGFQGQLFSNGQQVTAEPLPRYSGNVASTLMYQVPGTRSSTGSAMLAPEMQRHPLAGEVHEFCHCFSVRLCGTPKRASELNHRLLLRGEEH